MPLTHEEQNLLDQIDEIKTGLLNARSIKNLSKAQHDSFSWDETNVLL